MPRLQKREPHVEYGADTLGERSAMGQQRIPQVSGTDRVPRTCSLARPARERIRAGVLCKWIEGLQDACLDMA